ncbi:glucans biosynthesis glucosyltransferase MdoH [Pelagibacterium sp. H642]|uniref:glucans biosynthesis glucosyltransferase MdoH n=1 Tax=Pelagibacterium sp. H642 TaxID=1881069 RepID=UPI0028165DD9|nr:glucans biosynthesis glucosyltransferase MdoH [Pelagibacterium sp. H642]WMT92357.1 glucans biosynthesis glucosyltransferase MdoH [Pelagibacterium sp. H642]
MDRVRAQARLYRIIAFLLSLGLSGIASSLFIQFAATNGLDALDFVRLVLIAISTLWLAWGASQSVVGLLYRPQVHDARQAAERVRGRTAILVPIYNEDPVETFSRVLAMDRSIAREGMSGLFDFAILSDTRDPQTARQEEIWFDRLLEESGGKGRMFYRRRAENTGKKAGNVEDFITRSGGAYEFSLILDADSLMEGKTIVEMARRMEAEPRLGLLQTLPQIINAHSLFGRAVQFSASFFSPVFARGIALLAGHEGPFWGHNAMIRTQAFASSCGLPVLSGKPPFGGHVLSHDYVEAALLARNGWIVRLDTDLTGSFEEGPDNLVEFAKRDRRWCQGNLQHIKLLGAPRLSGWSRFVFVQGILSYLSSPIWAAFLILSLLAPYFTPAPDYFPEPYQLFPVFPDDQTSKAITLLVGIFGLLILPKLLILAQAISTGRVARHGGAGRATVSVLVEIVLSSIIAPVMLLFQTRSVFQVLTGADGGWPATRRGTQALPLSDAWMASRTMVLIGVTMLAGAAYFTPAILVWLVPVAGPMVVAPLLIWISSKPFESSIFLAPQECDRSPIVAERDAIVSSWSGGRSEPDPVGRAMREGAPTHA